MPEEQLSEEAARIVAEEEALLSRVQATLQATAAEPRRSDATLLDDLKELRDEATTATARDLPSLLQQMSALRGLLEREPPPPRPESSTPYFGHLRLRDASGSRDYLLGRATFANTRENVRIVDWRYAPIARIFYGYREGDPYEETFPGGISEGVVEARRVIVIERGVLTRILAGSLVLERGADGGWQARGRDSLSGGAGTAARPGFLGVGAGARERPERPDITALLDPVQFEAVNTTAGRALLVLGSAGSGKTTVALHRLAHLAFDNPARFPPGRMRVIVPEEGLARLSRRLLAPLTLGNVAADTLEAWLYRAACAAFDVKHIKMSPDTPSLVSRLKQHPALLPVILRKLGDARHARASLDELWRSLATVLSDRQLLREVVEGAKGDLPEAAIAQTARHTMLQLVTPLDVELEGYDPESLKTIDGGSIESGTPDELAGSYDPEDLALLLFLKGHGGGLPSGQLTHLVVDEAEDFSLFELDLLGRQLTGNGTLTLAGDEMQQTTAGFPGWPRALEAAGAPDAAICRLAVSYRCPRPVVELAQRVLGDDTRSADATRAREGAPIGFHHFPDAAQASLFLTSALGDLLDREPRASVGVVASSADAARRICEGLGGLSQVRLVLDGEFTFEPGIDVCDVDGAKGLEFDYVIIPDATATAYANTPEARRRLHVAITRTSHQLWVISTGTLSPLLKA
jgi:DNA helicase IV